MNLFIADSFSLLMGLLETKKLEIMNFSFKTMLKSRRRFKMSNPKKDSKHFRPSHLGTQPRTGGGNKGKQMQDTSGKHAQVIQTKGE